MHWKNREYFAVVVDEVLTKKECDVLIARSEKEGYEQALLNVGGGHQIVASDIRNSDRCIIDDPEFAQKLWERITSAVESFIDNDDEDDETKGSLQLQKLYTPENGWSAVGLNERLRILRYRQGEYFKPHFDGCYMRGNEAGASRKGETSYVTCQLYLNEGYQGGETRFLSCDGGTQESKVIPKTGSVLLFQHNLLHEGCPVTNKGQKYVVRTDVMYTSKGPGHEYSLKPINLGQSASDSFEAMQTD